jgi:hypothetical protein
MNEKDFRAWLIEELNRADKDYEMSTMTDDANYHQGEYDAFQTVLVMLGRA